MQINVQLSIKVIESVLYQKWRNIQDVWGSLTPRWHTRDTQYWRGGTKAIYDCMWWHDYDADVNMWLIKVLMWTHIQVSLKSAAVIWFDKQSHSCLFVLASVSGIRQTGGCWGGAGPCGVSRDDTCGAGVPQSSSNRLDPRILWPWYDHTRQVLVFRLNAICSKWEQSECQRTNHL